MFAAVLPHCAGVWHVYVRWLTDSLKYNEWMNPGDYETEAGTAAREAADAGMQGSGAEARFPCH